MCNLQHTNETPERFSFLHSNLKRGDIIGVKGFVGKTKAGELSVYPGHIQLLAPCNHNLPDRYGLKEHVMNYSNLSSYLYFSNRKFDLVVDT